MRKLNDFIPRGATRVKVEMHETPYSRRYIVTWLNSERQFLGSMQFDNGFVLPDEEGKALYDEIRQIPPNWRTTDKIDNLTLYEILPDG